MSVVGWRQRRKKKAAKGSGMNGGKGGERGRQGRMSEKRLNRIVRGNERGGGRGKLGGVRECVGMVMGGRRRGKEGKGKTEKREWGVEAIVSWEKDNCSAR